MKQPIFIFLILVFFKVSGTFALDKLKREATPHLKMKAPISEELAPAHFRELLQKYQKSVGVKMAFNKKAYFPLLKKSKTSRGEIFLSGKKILLKLKDHLNTRILFDGQKWWHIITPPGETKRVSPIQPDQNISVLFHPTAFFQNFRFVSQKIKGRAQILNFMPKSKSSPLQSLSVKVEQNRILKVEIKWQDSGNEEVFLFSNIRFNQIIPSSLFSTI